MKKTMNIEELRELESRTFIINADMERWKIIIDRKMQLIRLSFAFIISDDVIKIISKYLIESIKYNGVYIYTFRQNDIDNKKFLIKFEINTNKKEIMIVKFKKNIDKSYIFNKNKSFYYDNSMTLECFIKESIDRKQIIKKASMSVKNRCINKKGLRIVNKGFKSESM